jgi:SAM-dependent methyltransferase
MSNPYDADYYLHGKEKGVSLYENYRWLPELTLPMCKAIAEHCGFSTEDDILDFGCARGYVVKALRQLGYEAFGIDISQWAIDNCDPDVTGRVRWWSRSSHADYDCKFNWIIAKDVLEHVPDVTATINQFLKNAKIGIFVVVPLSFADDHAYVVSEYEKDVTHIHRFMLETWVSMFIRPGWSVEARYRLPGVKDNYASWERGNGFITCRRLP